jgi:uncharacterized membrane protein
MGKVNIKYIFLFIIIILIGSGLRYYGASKRKIWNDEITSISIATGINPITLLKYKADDGSIIFTAAEAWSSNKPEKVISNSIQISGGNATAYNLLLHYWIKLNGTSDASFRILSLFFGVGLIISAILFTLRLTFNDLKAGLLIGLFLAINFSLIYFSQEIRGYSMAIFFCLLATWLLYVLTNNGLTANKQLIIGSIYAIVIIIAFFSHFLTIGIFAAHLCWLLLFAKGWRIWRPFFILIILGVMTIGVFLMTGGYEGIKLILSRSAQYSNLAESKSNQTGFGIPTNFHTVSAGITQVLLYVFGNGLQNFGIQIRFIIPLLIIPCIIIWQSYLYFNEQKRIPVFWLLLLPLFMQLIIAIALAFISGHNIPFQVIYFGFSVPLVMIILTVGIKRILSNFNNGESKTVISKITVLLFILLMFVSLIPLYIEKYTITKTEKKLYSEIAKRVISKSELGDTIVYNGIKDAIATNFFLPDTLPHIQMIRYEQMKSILIVSGERKKIISNDF